MAAGRWWAASGAFLRECAGSRAAACYLLLAGTQFTALCAERPEVEPSFCGRRFVPGTGFRLTSDRIQAQVIALREQLLRRSTVLCFRASDKVVGLGPTQGTAIQQHNLCDRTARIQQNH